MALALTIAFAGSVSFGLSLHSGERGCNLGEMKISGCDHMGMQATAVAGIALCCLLDSHEPGPTSNSPELRIPSSIPFLDETAQTAVVTPPRPLPVQNWRVTTSFTPPETYLKNRAFLI